jgi:membrane protein
VEGSVATGNGAGTREVLARLRAEARAAETRDVVRALVRTYRENDLLTYASAISFQVFFALIPLLLFALGVLGFLTLDEAWDKDLAPEVEERVSPAVFTVVDDTVKQFLGAKHLFWISLGAAIAVWEISGAVRAIMQVFNRIYDVEETRRFWHRMRISLALAAVSGALILLTFALVRFGPLAVDALGAHHVVIDLVSFVARWAAAAGLMLVVVGVMVRFAPNCERPLHWVSFGALLVVLGWAVMSAGFWWYVTRIADYESIFGSLATVIVVLTYLYASVIAFLTGVQIDALVRDGFADRGDA